jgi:acyl-CoA thioesterase FadM
MYELKEANSNKVIALGETLMGCFDYVRQKPSKAPQKLLNILTN